MATRRYWEVSGWLLLIGVGFLASVGVELIDLGRAASTRQPWQIVVEEATSHIATLIIVPLLLVFDRYFPIRIDTWRRSLLAHGLFTIAWSLAHVVLFYWGRVALFAMLGGSYRWENWLSQFGYEYLKDARTYLYFVVFIYLYRFVLRRIQGEAGYLSEGKEEAAPVDITDRFLIKKLGREFLVRVDDIDWIEASGNYVNLHVDSRVYPLRETMAGISKRLAAHGFQRVHRSAIVNLDRVVEIVPYGTGDAEARLTSDVVVPVSRRYRKALRENVV